MRHLIPLLLAIAVGGCASPRMDMALADTAWQVEDLAGLGTIDRVMPWVRFQRDGHLVAFGGCNEIYGSWRVNEDRLAVGSLAQTKRGCVEAVMEQEARFVRLLTGEHRVSRLEEHVLLVASEGGEMRFVVMR